MTRYADKFRPKNLRPRAGSDLKTFIPYNTDQNIGKSYNSFMELVGLDDWVVFADHDVFLDTSPLWYVMACRAIEKYGDQYGLISCMTNRIGCRLQKDITISGHNILEHRDYAEKVYKACGIVIKDITGSQFKLSGMFMITSKKDWQNCGGFADGFLGVDNEYDQAIRNQGRKVGILSGLYLYHRYGA